MVMGNVRKNELNEGKEKKKKRNRFDIERKLSADILTIICYACRHFFFGHPQSNTLESNFSNETDFPIRSIVFVVQLRHTAFYFETIVDIQIVLYAQRIISNMNRN